MGGILQCLKGEIALIEQTKGVMIFFIFFRGGGGGVVKNNEIIKIGNRFLRNKSYFLYIVINSPPRS